MHVSACVRALVFVYTFVNNNNNNIHVARMTKHRCHGIKTITRGTRVRRLCTAVQRDPWKRTREAPTRTDGEYIIARIVFFRLHAVRACADTTKLERHVRIIFFSLTRIPPNRRQCRFVVAETGRRVCFSNVRFGGPHTTVVTPGGNGSKSRCRLRANRAYRTLQWDRYYTET